MVSLLAKEWHEVQQANYSYFPTGFPHPDRVMQSHDMIYLLEGEWEIWLEQSRYLLTPDHVLILPAGLHHYGKIPCKAATRTMYLHISSFPKEKGAPAEGAEIILLPELTDCRSDQSIRGIFADMIRLYWSAAPYKETELSARATQLFCALSRVKAPARISRRVAEIIQAIQEKPQQFFTIRELAKLAHLHPRTISDEFKMATGQTIHQYQMDLKLQMAYSEILAYPNRSFREIAGAYGFYDEFHFIKSFKNKFGFSPKFLRNAAK